MQLVQQSHLVVLHGTEDVVEVAALVVAVVVEVVEEVVDDDSTKKGSALPLITHVLF